MVFHYFTFIHSDLISCLHGIFCFLITNRRGTGGNKNNGIPETKSINGDMFSASYLLSTGYNNLRSWSVWRGYADHDLISVFLSTISKWIVFGEWSNWTTPTGLFQFCLVRYTVRSKNCSSWIERPLFFSDEILISKLIMEISICETAWRRSKLWIHI